MIHVGRRLLLKRRNDILQMQNNIYKEKNIDMKQPRVESITSLDYKNHLLYINEKLKNMNKELSILECDISCLIDKNIKHQPQSSPILKPTTNYVYYPPPQDYSCLQQSQSSEQSNKNMDLSSSSLNRENL